MKAKGFYCCDIKLFVSCIPALGYSVIVMVNMERAQIYLLSVAVSY